MLNAYSVYDLRAKSYKPPMFQQSHAAASRMFRDAVNNTELEIGRYPEEFQLVCTGTYDEQTGKMLNLEKPELVIDGSAAIRKEKVNNEQK